MEKGGKSSLPFEEKRRNISNLIDDLLDKLDHIMIRRRRKRKKKLNQIKNEEDESIALILNDFEKFKMELRFLRTFVLFGDSSLDDLHYGISRHIYKLSHQRYKLVYSDNDNIRLALKILDEMSSYMNLADDDYVAMTTEKKMFEYLFRNLHDLQSYCSKLLLPQMSDYKILRQVFRHLRDFYPILKANITSTEYLYPRFQFIAHRVVQFCFDLWTRKHDKDFSLWREVALCSPKITSLLINIISLEMEVLHICTSKLMKESRSTKLEQFVEKIVKASPWILQNYLILIQGRMVGAVAVMIEFLLIFLTDIPKCFIHHEKLNDVLAHVGVLTRKISILVKDSSEINNINEADVSAPDFLLEIEQMKGDIRQIFLKPPESSQLHFPMDDGFLFMNLLLTHLNELLISNAYSVALIKKEIGMVKQSLEFIKSSFRKVRQTLDDSSGVVKDCWVRALDVAYEAEHIINCILVRDKALSHLIFSLPSVIDKITFIVAEVTSLQLEDKNGNDPLDATSSDETIELTSSSFIEVTVGHEEEEAQIIDQLLDEHESELDVISIVGMPGLGKTTLANKVYKNTFVASHFNVRAWCTVSQKYNKSKVLREILQQVTGSEGIESEEDLAEKLRRALLDKRYLIVLDDVWDIATAEMLIPCFPKVERGNRIILTSRSSKVGLQVKCRSDPLHLQLLTPEKSWELFEKRVFGDQGSCPVELSEVGHQIVEKCQGLPLALVLIAGVIVKGKEKDLWLMIQHDLDSFISENNNLEMMKVMQLSYDHLPYHLKPLLLYFARYRKSKQIPVSKLMQLCMAEGFVDHDIRSKSSLEEATQSYLDALISSSLIMVDHSLSKSSYPFSGMIKVCYVHDVVHDFCSVIAKKENFIKLLNSDDVFHASDSVHHRLSIHTDHGQFHKKCVLFNSNKSSGGSKHLISLKVNGSFDYSIYICHTRHLRLLRVLQLGRTVLGDSLMEEIGFLFHLKFLKIQTDVKALPVSWLNLQNLETLLIQMAICDSHPQRYPFVMVLLPGILKLSKLKHVSVDYLSSFVEVDKDWDIIMDQPSRILEAENSKLESLTTLSKVLISNSEGTSDALEKFPNLQHLDCIIKDSPTHGDWVPKFDVLNKLESLLARYGNVWTNYYDYNDRELIEKFLPPNEYHFPTRLKELRLYGFPVRPALLSAITALPKLEILEFMKSNFIEDKWDASKDIYQSLKTSYLKQVNLSEGQVDRETFPKLEELTLEHCDELTEIPSEFGGIDTLKSIHLICINNSDLGDSADEIKKDVQAFTGEDRLNICNVAFVCQIHGSHKC